jgi:hypothetical protein
MAEDKYAGTELELFAAAENWKSYWSSRIRPFIAGDVLEVGAGIGVNTKYLDHGGKGRWVCLEPDSQLMAQLAKISSRREVVCGTLRSLDASQMFDTIIYIDVLEHIAFELSRFRGPGAVFGKRTFPAAAAAHAWADSDLGQIYHPRFKSPRSMHVQLGG